MSAMSKRAASDGSTGEVAAASPPQPPARVTLEEFGIVDVSTRGRTYFDSADTKRLLESVTYERIHGMTTRFYEKMFLDEHIKQFVFLDDGAEAHGRRLALWIAEKMGGGPVWTSVRPNNSRSQSHRRAWDNDKRPAERAGWHFKLDDSRVWMRLMFWAAREEGLHLHEPFWEWYVGFIQHFIAVYEFSAPPYAEKDAAWSSKQKNIDAYLEGGRVMADVIGKLRGSSWY